jgi:hypothetical protein
MSIDFTTSIAQNKQAADQAKFADLTFVRPLQQLQFPKTPNPSIFKFDVLPVNDQLAYGRASIHRLPTGMIVCPQGTFGKPCPICEAIRNRPRDDKQFWADNHAVERAYLNVVPLDTEGQPVRTSADDMSPIYYFCVGSSPKAKGGFWKLLTSALSSPAPEDTYKRLFADWSQGLTLKLNLTPADMNGTAYMEVSGIEFIPRKTQYDKSQWSPHCYQFNELFNSLEYDAIKEMCPHLFGSNAGTAVTNTGYSPTVPAHSTRPDGIYPPQQPQSPQQGGFYPPAPGQQPVTYTQPQVSAQPAFAQPQSAQPPYAGIPAAPSTGTPNIF